jgi:lipid-A-disaccharide synthase
MSRTIFLLAGEASGDTRGAELIRALRKEDPALIFAGMGGPRMRAEGMEIVEDVSNLALVGIVEVLKHYAFFKRLMERLLADAARRQPAAVVGVDYPGFNLRFLKAVKERVKSSPSRKLRTIQYVSPQIWAWHESRKWRMAEYLDRILCIFPFEPALYEGTGLQAIYVGHPLCSQIAAGEKPRDPNLVAFFPGSREKEIRLHLPVMHDLERRWKTSRPHLRVVYAAADERTAKMIQSHVATTAIATASELQAQAAVGVVCSGTATLEAALAGLPMCVVYRVAWPTYWMGRALIRVPHLAMPNLLAGRLIVKEFIQDHFTADRVAAEVERLLDDPGARTLVAQGYAEVRARLGEGRAAEQAAREILRLIQD